MPRSWLKGFSWLLVIALALLPSTASGISSDRVIRIIGLLRNKSPDRLLRVVAPYIGRVPYTWGGSSVVLGMDCSAFSRHVMKKFGVDLPRTVREQAKVGSYVRPGMLKAGDLVFFDASRKRPGLDHVGIYLGEGRFAHSTKPVGVTMTRLRDYIHPVKFGRRVLA